MDQILIAGRTAACLSKKSAHLAL